jgi:uncharacterized phage protein (TIGR01671 family)
MKSELFLDEDGYPTDLSLTLIKKANPFEKNPHELMDFVKRLWQYSDWGWSTKKKKMSYGKKAILYSISTGGWSGNESIISALKNNENFFWTLYWQSSKVGGHYKFLIPKEFEKSQESTEEESKEASKKPPVRDSNPSDPCTCGHCGKVSHNVPRLEDSGGFVHKDNLKFECANEKPMFKPSKLNFRSWDHQTKRFSYFDLRNNMGHPPTDIPDNQVNQSSGLLDKNGREIYEGDILCQYPDYVNSQGGQLNPTISKVYFEFGCFYFNKLPLNEFIENEILTNNPRLKAIEIVGNIFENRELLK